MAVTLKDVAEKAQVSLATASQALNPSGCSTRVGKATCERVKEVARTLKYLPNNSARMLAGKSGKLIGVLIDSMAPAINFIALAEIEKILVKKGYRLLIGQAHDDPEALGNYVRDFRSQGVDGVICFAHDYPGQEKSFKEISRIVFIDKPSFPAENYIDIDLASGVKNAVKHLIKQGYKRIGLGTSSSGSAGSKKRVEGYLKGIKYAQGETRKEHILFHDLPVGNADSYRELARLYYEELIIKKKLDAIIGLNDTVCMALLELFKIKGIRCPEDVALIGLNNTVFGDLANPALTTININLEIAAKKAADLLIKILVNDSTNARKTFVKSTLVIRRSSIKM